MSERHFTITDPLGLHARPATVVVQAAKPFAAKVEMVSGERAVNLKSLMMVLSLGLTQGAQFTVRADGEDAQQAVDAVAAVLQSEGLAQ